MYTISRKRLLGENSTVVHDDSTLDTLNNVVTKVSIYELVIIADFVVIASIYTFTDPHSGRKVSLVSRQRY